MSHRLTVRNIGTESVLVGARYLLPGEEREVLESHYEAAGGKDRLAVVDPPPPVEVEAVLVEETPPPSRKRSSK